MEWSGRYRNKKTEKKYVESGVMQHMMESVPAVPGSW